MTETITDGRCKWIFVQAKQMALLTWTVSLFCHTQATNLYESNFVTLKISFYSV